MIKSLLSNLIASAVEEIGLPTEKIELFHPELSFGDFSTNIALVLAKKNNEEAPKLAEKIKTKILSLKNEKHQRCAGGRAGLSKFYFVGKLFCGEFERNFGDRRQIWPK